jgi:hypothetical protein
VIVSATALVTAAVAAAIVLAVAGGREPSSDRTATSAPPAASAAAPTAAAPPDTETSETSVERGSTEVEDDSRPEPAAAGEPAKDAVRGAVHALTPAGGGAASAAAVRAAKQVHHALTDRITEKNPTPSAWDVTGYVPKALATARSYFPDAVLVRIDADGVYPTGKANLQLDSDFDVTYRFMSPSAAVRPKDLPLGVEHKPTCMLYIVVEAAEIQVYTLEGWSCADAVQLRLPRCPARTAWARAAAQGAPTKNAVAQLTYWMYRGRPMWLFQIGDEQHDIADDC